MEWKGKGARTSLKGTLSQKNHHSVSGGVMKALKGKGGSTPHWSGCQETMRRTGSPIVHCTYLRLNFKGCHFPKVNNNFKIAKVSEFDVTFPFSRPSFT